MTRSDHFVVFGEIKISRMFLLHTLLGLAALSASLLFWWATELHGIGIHSDSVRYLWVAENLSKGLGFGITNAIGQFIPISDWPPLYPALLAVFLWPAKLANLPLSAEQVAHFLGILLTGGSTWILGRVVAKVSNRSVLFVLFGIVFMLGSPVFWDTYLYVMSEPLFIFLCLLAIYFFMEYLRTYSTSTLFWAGLFVGLSILTRYAGIFLIPVMGISIYFYSNRSPKRNFFAFSHITALGLFPILLWGLRNYTLAGLLPHQRLGFTPLSPSDWRLMWASLLDWFSPFIDLFKITPALAAGSVLAFVLLMVSLVGYYRKRVYGNNESQEKWWKILILYIVFYTFFLLLSRLFFDATIHLDEARMFFPVYIGVMLLFISLFSNAEEIKYLVLRKYLFYAVFGTVIITALLFTWLNIEKTQTRLLSSRENGLALNSTEFQDRPLWPELKELTLEAKSPLFFSDNVEELYWGNKTSSDLLIDIDHDINHQLLQYGADHDIIIVLIDHPETSTELIKALPSAQMISEDVESVIFILRSTPSN